MTVEVDSPGYALELREIKKSFGRNEVLKGVSMALEGGKVTALLGANGAGKSTLIKILAGVYDRDDGQILVDGRAVEIANPLEAAQNGIHTVHQRIDESIVPGLSVAENLLFDELVQGAIPPVGSLRRLLPRARAIAATLELDWPDSKLLSDAFELGIADAQLLVLARGLAKSPKVLILDEPTSTLSQAEADNLFGVIERLRDSGVAVLYVSHHLSEIRSLADELVVLRDGLIKDRQSAPLDLERAVRSMLSEEVAIEAEHLEELHGERVAVELSGVQLLKRSEPINVSFNYGEVTGIVGLLGAGKSELARGIYGVEPFRRGTISLDGKRFQPHQAADAVRQGIYLVPEDRASEAMLPGWSLARTICLPFMGRVSRAGVIDKRAERSRAKRVIDDFKVMTTGLDQSMDALSGGNQQKVVVGRWMTGEPKVILLDEPFRGVDIGARHDISRKTRDAAAHGACVVVLSSDIEEIREVADRILVMVEGQIALDRRASQTDADAIMASMSEVTPR